jgi:integrase/recombinase XerC
VTTARKRSKADDEIVRFMTELIGEHIRHCAARGLAQTTRDSRERLLRYLDRDLPMGLGQATIEELEDFLASHDDDQTKATYYGHITAFFRWASDPANPRIDFDPSAGLRRPRVAPTVPKPATNAQLAEALQLDDPWRLYVKLAAYAGARCCEIANLDRSDVTAESIRLTGKSGKTRVVPTHGVVWEAVKPLPAGRIARKVRDGAPVTAGYISTSMIMTFNRNGMAGMSLHRLRHWYATMQLRPVKYGGAGASIRTVQSNMGHSTLATTAIYTLVTDEERADAIDSLPTFATPTSS